MSSKRTESNPTVSLGEFQARVKVLEKSITESDELPVVTEQLTVAFGLQPPEKVIQAWGARTIFYKEGGFDLVWDRQGYEAQPGVDEERKRLFMEFINELALPRMRKMSKELSINERREIEHRLGRYVVRANPNASYGYLYICAYEEPLE